jgi:hypothetical protein
MFGAPGEIRTPDQLVRSQLLYPAELRARGARSIHMINQSGNDNFDAEPNLRKLLPWIKENRKSYDRVHFQLYFLVLSL